MLRERLLSCALVSVALCAAAVPAQAAFPGKNGKIAFANSDGGTFDVWVMNPDGSAQTPLTSDADDDSQPAWSSDGKKLVFLSERDSTEDDTIREIYVMNADGSGQTRLTNNDDGEVEPAWSPDGTKIAFTSVRDGNEEIYVMNADGTGQVNRTNNPALDAEPAWSPDGTKIAFTSERDGPGNREIYVMNADGTGPARLTTSAGADREPTWSPDGTKIAFTSLRDGNEEIYVMNADGTGPVNRTNNAAGDFQPFWSPDSGQIAFTSTRDGRQEIYVMSAADGSGQTRLTNRAQTNGFSDWQPEPVCPVVQVGFATAQGCFRETASGSGVFETEQKAWVGGFEIQPRPDGKLVLDTNNPGVSEGGAGADIVFRGRALPFPVSALPVSVTGAAIPFGQPGTLSFLFDVPVKGSVAVAWAENGTASSFEAEIEINELTAGIGAPDPSTLGSGKLKAQLVNGMGFKLEEFEVKIDEISVTPARLIVPRKLKLKNLLLKMELRTDAAGVEKPFWTGQAGITLPLTRGELDVLGRAFIFDGDLVGGGFEVDGLNRPIPSTPLFLQKVGGDLLFQPRWGFTLLVGGSLGPRVRGQLLMDIDGTMQAGELVSGCNSGSDPSKLEFTAKLTPLAVLEANGLAKADLSFRTCFYTGSVSAMELTGSGKIDFLGGVIGYEGSQTGFISTRGANLEGAVKLRVPGFPDLNGQAIVSTAGIAACADFSFFKGGFGYGYGGPPPALFDESCDIGDFRVTASAASVRARTSVATRVPAGLPHAAFAARSRRGAPRVKVTGPGGFKVTSPARGKALRTRRVVIVPVAHEKTTYVIVNDPGAGAWKVESLERRKPISRVAFARGLPKPKVKAKLRKRGKKMVLTYTLTPLPGQKVVFNERGVGVVARSIGRARGRKGRITFTPTRGTPTRRTIEAEVVQNGLPRAMITVARFRASP